MKGFKKLLLAALLVRVLLSFFSFHSDLTTYAIWGRYAQEFGLRGFYDWLNFGTYARPDYPPLAMILFLFVRVLWSTLFGLFWKINVAVGAFPSLFIPWFEDEGYRLLFKLPSILADIGIGVLIFNFFKKRIGFSKAKLASSLYLFNPAVIYLTASWGQLDGFVGFFALATTLLVLKKSYLRGVLAFFVSIMTKATFVPMAPVLVINAVRDKISLKKTLFLAGFTTASLVAVSYLFIDKDYLSWVLDLYFGKIVKGAVTLPYINLNAFNFWGLVVGLERVKDSVAVFALSLNTWAWLITGGFLIFILLKFARGKDIFFTLFMLFFAVFMFSPRVHERYLYPVFVFLPFLLFKYPKLLKAFWILSFVFLINLYHWWWFPRVALLVDLLENDFVERALSLLNLAIFGFMLKEYASEK